MDTVLKDIDYYLAKYDSEQDSFVTELREYIYENLQLFTHGSIYIVLQHIKSLYMAHKINKITDSIYENFTECGDLWIYNDEKYNFLRTYHSKRKNMTKLQFENLKKIIIDTNKIYKAETTLIFKYTFTISDEVIKLYDDKYTSLMNLYKLLLSQYLLLKTEKSVLISNIDNFNKSSVLSALKNTNESLEKISAECDTCFKIYDYETKEFENIMRKEFTDMMVLVLQAFF